jgi:Flp pilus assembly protein TadG
MQADPATELSQMFTFMKESARSFRNARGGNTTMIFALSMPVLIFGMALAIDFTNYTVVKSRLNAAADAAALAALTPAMMQQSTTVAQAAAAAMFTARADALGSLVTGKTSVTVTVTPSVTSGGNTRTVLVSYSAMNNTIFSGILNTAMLGVSGSATAQASIPPNIDFYLLLDNSPSMALPSSTTGITSMIGYTPTQDGGNGCAFACHMSATTNSASGASPVYQSTDTMGNLCTDSTTPPFPMCTTSSGAGKGSIATQNSKQLLAQYCSPDPYCTTTINSTYTKKYTSKAQMDNYAMARHYGISLRLDELTAGVTAMMTDANGIQTSGIYSTPPAYRFAAYQMDSTWQIGMSSYTSTGTSSTLVMPLTSSYQSSWTTNSSNFTVLGMYSNNNSCGSAACTSTCSSSTCGPYGYGDVGTNFDNAMSTMNTILPTPGNGTNVTGDKPQEVLFFVTDGVEDETNINRLIQPINGNSGTNYCTTIKNRGIKIAILYTQYLPVPTNAFYESSVAPIISNVPTALQACASPGLFVQASLNDNLSQDLSSLFEAAIQSAALIN